VAVVFGVRSIDALGHRLRTDACVMCGHRRPPDQGAVAVDVEVGGIVCAACAVAGEHVRLEPASLAALRRLRGSAWEEATAAPLGRAGRELRDLLDRQVTCLIGQPPRTSRFVREIERFSPSGGGRHRA
jgi:recombinational DNA repair protein (RecF pathway)